jgi:putative holliday junction resolvase
LRRRGNDRLEVIALWLRITSPPVLKGRVREGIKLSPPFVKGERGGFYESLFTITSYVLKLIANKGDKPISRLMALDIGDARIGLALSDPLRILASPFKILTRTDTVKDIQTILALAKENDVTGLIAGLPVNMDGTQGGQAQKVKDFVKELKLQTQLPVTLKDERLTTVEAKNALKTSHKNANRLRYDAHAAALILQSYLDEHLPPKELPPDGE